MKNFTSSGMIHFTIWDAANRDTPVHEGTYDVANVQERRAVACRFNECLDQGYLIETVGIEHKHKFEELE